MLFFLRLIDLCRIWEISKVPVNLNNKFLIWVNSLARILMDPFLNWRPKKDSFAPRSRYYIVKPRNTPLLVFFL